MLNKDTYFYQPYISIVGLGYNKTIVIKDLNSLYILISKYNTKVLKEIL